jgi:hypothetical protein
MGPTAWGSRRRDAAALISQRVQGGELGTDILDSRAYGPN